MFLFLYILMVNEQHRFLLMPVIPAPLFQIQALGPQFPDPLSRGIGRDSKTLKDISKSSDIVLRNPAWI